MREIKFRGKRIDNGDWVVGGIAYLDYYDGENYIEGAWVTDGNNKSYEVNPDTVSQYTGLKDCNGVEIYEDDIIVVDNGIGYKARVYFGGGAFKRVPIGSGEASADLIFSGWYGPEDYKVIGNIYEDAELLK